MFDKDNESDGAQSYSPSAADWGGTVTQDGIQKPVLEAIVDLMSAENIEENLR